MTLTEGQLLHERYRIEHLVAQGGYGAVYKALDTTLNRSCAVKENLLLGSQAEQQFEQEALLLARLNHPNLPRVTDHFILPGRGQYLVMDFVEGRTLESILRRRLRPFSQEEALAMIRQVCAALIYLHNQTPPIVHRDVKPQNIIVISDGPVMLVDFGVSKLLYKDAVTAAGARGITPGFAAPEQYGLAPTDPRSDVYSTGATLYTLLTGERPADALQRMTEHLPLAPIRQYNGAVAPAFEQAVYRAMEPVPTQRLQSVAALLQALESAGRSRRSLVRAPWLMALAIGGVALFAILVLGLLRSFVGGVTPDMAAPAVAGAVGGPALVQPSSITPLPTLFIDATPTVAVAATAAAPASPTPSPTELSTSAPASAPTATSLPVTSTAVPTVVPTVVLTVTPTMLPTPLPPVPTPFGGGGVIVYDSDEDGSRDIYRMYPDGSNVTNLTNNPADDWVGSFSPDGRWLLYSSNRNGNWDIYVQDMEQGTVVQLTQDTEENHDPAWSPSGDHILFHSNRSDGVWRLYSMAANGEGVRVLTHNPEGAWAGAWSPDGSKIVYSANFPQPGDIYVMEADGSNAVNLTNTATHESTAHWSPDGSRIAFYADRDGNRDIYVMNSDGSNPQRLTSDPAVDSLPTWSPDGQHIVFASDRGGNMDLYRLDLSSGDVQQLTDSAAAQSSPSWSPY